MTKTTYPTKLNVNASTLRTFFSRFQRDYDELAELFFPHKLTGAKREAFVLIIQELLSNDGKTKTLNHLANPPKMPLSTICKARKEMRLMGLIDYRDYHWQLSTRLANNLRKMADLLDSAMNKR